jgi:predicted Zn-dependent protease
MVGPAVTHVSRPMRMPYIVTAILAVLLVSCATNPVTGKKDVTLMSQKSEVETGRRIHDEVIRSIGVYQDQALQDYVNGVGQRLAKLSHRSELEFHFTVLDTDDVNAFATMGGYVYISRGIMPYLNSEAELAAVIGHEIGHITARHAIKQQSQNAIANILGMGAVIATGSSAVADIAGISSEAVLRGYGRDMELQADSLGAEYLARAGYDPQAIIWVVGALKNQETFERDRAKAEGREPQIYHGVFATHPDNDTRLQQAVLSTQKVSVQPTGGGDVNRDAYLDKIDGLPFGSSRQQGIIRDNRFYHADLGITMAFPKDWVVQNQPTRILAGAKSKDTLMQFTVDALKDNETPQEYLRRTAKEVGLDQGRPLNLADGLQGYTAIATRANTPFGVGPMRVGAIAMGKSVFVFMGASRSSSDAVPAADRVFVSVMETFRKLRTAEFPLAEPLRLKILRADANTRVAQVAKNSSVAEFATQQIRLINDLYPNKEFKSDQRYKTVE